MVGTLWPVNDRSTALLATRFYELYLGGQPPASALRLAQRWLRDVTNTQLGEYLATHLRLKDAMVEETDRLAWTLIVEERRRVRRALAAGEGASPPYEHPYFWAPFAFYGAGG